MFVLEALRAKYGDALLLHWGTRREAPPGGDRRRPARASSTTRSSPAWRELRAERGLAATEPLDRSTW